MDNIILIDELKIRKFIDDDLKGFKKFTPYDDILLTDYNLSFLTERELKNWKKKINSPSNSYYAVIREDELIGYIGISKISFLNSNFELSISFDSKYISKGYGFMALKSFLNYFFKNFKKNSIWLNVNSFNERAIKLYEKIGFKRTTEFLGDFEVQDIEGLKRFEEID